MIHIVGNLKHGFAGEFYTANFSIENYRIFERRTCIELYAGSICQRHLHPLACGYRDYGLAFTQRTAVIVLSEIGSTKRNDD